MWVDNTKSGLSGLMLVDDNRDALAARILAARSALRTLDLMYYLWYDDGSGRLLTSEVIAAADRGVRVRILLDDINPRSSDAGYLALDGHPNIEVRLFNPSGMRNGSLFRLLEMAARLFAMTRRMHTKAWIADDRVAIVGGRNIGDAYFDAADTNFRDLDLLLLGSAVRQTMEVFEAFWNCKAARPLHTLHPRSTRRQKKTTNGQAVASMPDPVAGAASIDEFVAGSNAVYWTERARVISDPPDKVWGIRRRKNWLMNELLPLIVSSKETLDIASPYFIPGRKGVAILASLVRRGVRVAVLTNSLAATDVAAVHGGYANYRRALLRAGVKLFELQPFARKPDISMFGSKGASLHTKAFTVDDRMGFIGSFNFDPRSVSLNSEMGVIFEEAALVRALRERLELEKAPQTSYAVDLHRGRLRWRGAVAGEPEEFDREPEASLKRRLLAALVRYLPIESQL